MRQLSMRAVMGILIACNAGFGAEDNVSSKGASPLLMTQEHIAAAISYGKRFRTRNRYLREGMKHSRIQIASAFAMDGMSKYVTFFSDFHVVASAAAAAENEMRELSQEEIAKLPLSGLLYAHVEVHARGLLPVRKLERRYTRNDAHLVLQIDNQIIQPLSKRITGQEDTSVVLPVALYTWWEVGKVSLLTGGTLGFEGQKVELEFAFKLDKETANKKATVILIDGDGNRHKGEVDLSKVFGPSV